MTNLQNDGFLSLVQQSITLIPTDDILNHDYDHDNEKSTAANDPSIPSFKGNLHKICFAKKRLRASLKHWINSKVGNAKCLSSYDAYLERARADGYFGRRRMTPPTALIKEDECIHKQQAAEQDEESEEDPTIPNRHKLLTTNTIHDFADASSSIMDPDTFLDVYHEGILYLGVIVDQQDDKLNSSTHNNNDMMTEESSPPSSVLLLVCAARLYRHLLWRRSFLAQLEATTAYGFVVTCGQGSTGDFLAVYKLKMTLPSTPPSSTTIGSRVPVHVERKNKNHASISVTDSQAALTLLQDLGIFFLTPRADLAKVKLQHDNHPTILLSSSCLYPGPVMLLPDGFLRQRLQQEQKASQTDMEYSPPRYKVMPTITGSLVIRCSDMAAAEEIVHLDFLRKDSNLATTTGASWYVKCKTPLLYGPFWETSKLAINGTRKRLQLLLSLEQQQSSSSSSSSSKKHAGLSDRHVQVGKDWLFMHPFDAIQEPHRSLIVVREMGPIFKGQLCWKDFVVSFEALLLDTLILQNMVQLVHGDIHAGNVLLFDPCSNQGGDDGGPPKLILVDWDEASREKPFHRIAKTEEEKQQYPAPLIDFPDLYTKYQLQELFEYYIKTYYSDYAEAWSNYQKERGDNKEQGFQSTVRHRQKLLGAFLSSTSTE